MALKVTHKEISFGIGDTVKVFQSILEGSKKRTQVFEGMVIAIRGREENKNFVVRRIGSQQVGIEKIFPVLAPVIEKVEVVKVGVEGTRRAKLYYTRDISKREVEKIYQRKAKRERAAALKPKKRGAAKKLASKKPAKKVKK